MATTWGLRTESVEAKTWTRSWRQEFFTDLGEDFRVVAHIEDVTVLPNGVTASTRSGQVTRSMSAVGKDPRVQELARLMTELVKEWMDEDASIVSTTSEEGL